MHDACTAIVSSIVLFAVLYKLGVRFGVESLGKKTACIAWLLFIVVSTLLCIASEWFRGVFARIMFTVCSLVILAALIMWCDKHGGYSDCAGPISRDDHPEDW